MIKRTTLLNKLFLKICLLLVLAYVELYKSLYISCYKYKQYQNIRISALISTYNI